MMKKVVFLGISTVIFIGLTLIAFNLSEPQEEREVSKPATTVSSKPAVTPTPTVSEAVSGDFMVIDFKASYIKNVVNLSWKQPTRNDIQNLKIIRTPATSEGGSAVYTIMDSSGKYTDKNVKPGLRYYYEMTGKTNDGTVYSAIAAVEIPGNMQIDAGQNYMLVNDEKRYFDPNKKIKSLLRASMIFLPAKSVTEVLGGTVYWVSENQKRSDKAAILKFRKNEIEMVAGKKSIVYNRKEKKIDPAPFIQDGVLFMPYTMVSDYLAAEVIREGNVLEIQKAVNENTQTGNAKIYPQDLSVMQEEAFEISLMDPTMDGKKWYYYADNADSFLLTAKKIQQEKDGNAKVTFIFKAQKKGEAKLTLKYFNPRLGEEDAEQIWKYSILVNPK